MVPEQPRGVPWLSDTSPHTLTDIQRAARFYYLQQNCFGGRVEGRTFGTAMTSPTGAEPFATRGVVVGCASQVVVCIYRKAGLACLHLSTAGIVRKTRWDYFDIGSGASSNASGAALRLTLRFQRSMNSAGPALYEATSTKTIPMISNGKL